MFSGIGGFALAAQWAGIETVGFCEIEEFPQKVLQKNFPDIPIHKDINDLNGEDYAGIDIITGGFPCQPFSVAGNQKAQEDNRHLWPQMFRVISQAEPTWVICENVYGLVKLGLDEVQHDLESRSYTTQSFVIPSLANGANHRRDRVYIVAYSTSNGCNESQATRSNEKTDDDCEKREKQNRDDERRGRLRDKMGGYSLPTGRRRTKPDALRVDDELPDRMDRNKSLGNAIDPYAAYSLLNAIKQYPPNYTYQVHSP